MILYQNDLNCVLRWYWRYNLVTSQETCGLLDRIDQFLLLGRFSKESLPITLNDFETNILFYWLQTNRHLAAEFPFLAEQEKELIRKIYQSNSALLAGRNHHSPSIVPHEHSSLFNPKISKTIAGRLSIWWRHVVIQIKWAVSWVKL